MQLTINSVEEKQGKTGGVYYQAETSLGKFSSSLDLRPFIGKSADFKTAKSRDGKYSYINDPLPAIPAESQPSSQTSKEDYFVLSYCKDLTVAAITSGQLNALDTRTVSNYVLALYDQIFKELAEGSGIQF